MHIMTNKISFIDFETILPIWRNKLWPDRTSVIESHSAMMITPGIYDAGNFNLPIWYYGFYLDDMLVGVNSVHECTDGLIRSRGFWVDDNYRGRGIGTQLLASIVNDIKMHKFKGIWSYPRKQAWSVYERVGFRSISDWEESETGTNMYCYMDLQ